MNIVTKFDPSSALTGTFNVVFPGNRGKMLVYNESNVNLMLTFSSSDTTYVPAWTAMIYCLNNLTSPLVTWSVFSQLTSSGAPISQVVIETFDANEPVPGTYPAPLVRQTNIGNAVSTVATGSSFLLNNGSPPLTNIITATPSDAGSATWNADNSGNLTVKSDNAGTLTTLLQLIAGASPAVKLAAASVLTEALGNLKADGTFESVGAATLDSTLAVTGTSTFTGDVTFNGAGNSITVAHNSLVSGNEAVTGTLTVTGDATFNGAGSGVTVANNLAVAGTSSLDNGAIVTDGTGGILYTGKLGVSSAGDVIDASTGASTYFKARSGGAINFQTPDGTTTVSISSSGFLTLVHSLNLVVGSLGQLSTFNGTGNQTVATGVTNPTAIAFDPCTVSGSSQTIGGTVASSSVVTTGSGLAWRGTAWHS